MHLFHIVNILVMQLRLLIMYQFPLIKLISIILIKVNWIMHIDSTVNMFDIFHIFEQILAAERLRRLLANDTDEAFRY